MDTVGKTLDNLEWYNALFLDERIDTSNISPLEIKGDLINEWVINTGLHNKNLLSHRLEADKLSYKEFENILSTTNKSNDYIDMPWFKYLKEVFEKSYIGIIDKELDNDYKSKVPFVEFNIPFLEHAKDLLLQELKVWEKEYNLSISLETTLSTLLKEISNRILDLSYKVLIYELNKDRIEEKLIGDTPEERYQYFIKARLGNKGKILTFLLEYPVLARLISTTTERVSLFLLAAIKHFIEDRSEITSKIKGDFSNISNICMMGDTHNDGKCVLKFEFSSGDKLIYKPHSLKVDVHFQELLLWFNKKMIKNPITVMGIIDKGEYGWMEYIPSKECESLKEVKNYYEIQGQYLAILYMLNATDFHFENLIASGANPFFIDLEALFHNEVIISEEQTATSKAQKELSNSVLRTMLLPISIKHKDDLNLDVSGLSGNGKQKYSGYQIINLFTDEMKIKMATLYTEEQSNQPRLKGNIMTPENYNNEINSGFSDAYKIILDNKQELLSETGPLYLFKDARVRKILRPTVSYAGMLDASTHPKYFKNGLSRVQLFDFMWKAGEHSELFNKVIPSECRDLLNGDIPYFSSNCDSSILLDQRGKEIKDLYRQDSFSNVIKKIKSMSHKDCKKQMHYISQSLNTLRYLENPTPIKSTDVEYDESIGYYYEQNKQIFLQEAIRIAEVIEKQAVWGDKKDDITWISTGININDQIEYKVMDVGLYDGIMGVCLFYGYLGKVTGDEKYSNVAKACLNTVLSEYINKEQKQPMISAFIGHTSVIYTITHLADIWNDTSLLSYCEQLIQNLDHLIANDKVYDFLGGSAGAIIVCLDYYKQTGYKKALEVAIKCGDHLLKNYKEAEKGIYWLSESRANASPLAGLSHGVTGISWALLRLYRVTQRNEYKVAALKGLEYEHTLYNNELKNWADMREKQSSYSVFWCHGASGVGLGRLMMLDEYNHESIKTDLDNAIFTTINYGFQQSSHSLCHGDLGNLDLLLLASRKLNNTLLKKESYLKAGLIFEEFKTHNFQWKCGIPGEDPTPNLMLGLSGIGYELLRLFDEENIPSVLVLEPPVNNSLSKSTKEEEFVSI